MPFFQDCYVGCQFYVNRRVISQPVLNSGQWRERGRHAIAEGNINCGIRCLDVFVCLFFVYVAIPVAAVIFIVGV